MVGEAWAACPCGYQLVGTGWRCKGAFTYIALAYDMQSNPIPIRPRTDLLTLKVDAERAGLAWACPFSSSDEFEAAVIRSRREAGVYGPKRSRRRALQYMTAGAAVAAILIASAYLLV